MSDRVTGGVLASMWRALSVFRVASCAFCVYVVVRYHGSDARPGLALVAAAGIIAWTVFCVVVALRGLAHRAVFVLADVLVVAGLTLLTIPVQTYAQAHGDRLTLTSTWAASPVLGAAILGGWPAGLGAAAFQGAVSVVVRGGYDGRTVFNIVVLVLAGTCVGYVTRLAVRAEAELAAAAQARSALAERERLARTIHDGVLQVLALVQRRGAELGGAAADLGRLAGEQEASLRALVTSPTVPSAAVGEDELAARLIRLRAAGVTVSVPAEPVPMRRAAVDEICAAVGAALDNVARHAGRGAHAWVLLEDLGAEVLVTVRDDGVGIADGRLDEAAEQGRLGVRSSIRGRLAGLGGATTIVSAPGEGTEIELRVRR